MAAVQRTTLNVFFIQKTINALTDNDQRSIHHQQTLLTFISCWFLAENPTLKFRHLQSTDNVQRLFRLINGQLYRTLSFEINFPALTLLSAQYTFYSIKPICHFLRLADVLIFFAFQARTWDPTQENTIFYYTLYNPPPPPSNRRSLYFPERLNDWSV